MNSQQQGLADIQDIRRIMERSSRFISLSGWSGIAAGTCALVGAGLAWDSIAGFQRGRIGIEALEYKLLGTAAGVFFAAFLLAFLFTYIRSRREGVAIWGKAAQRLLFNTLVPLVAGGFVCLRMLETEYYGFIAPCCLIFYGLALVNGSKYTLGEIRWLGYSQIVLGIFNLWMPGNGLFFWALGFGVLHIIYGAVMWWKYERDNTPESAKA